MSRGPTCDFPEQIFFTAWQSSPRKVFICALQNTDADKDKRLSSRISVRAFHKQQKLLDPHNEKY